MSVRARLALWSAAGAAIVLLLVTGTAYVLHVRGRYDDLDRSLTTTAEHFQGELTSAGSTPNEGGFASGDPNIIVQLYDAGLAPLDAANDSIPPPPLTPLQVLAQDAGPAYDQVLRWLPGGARFDTGAFATTRDQATGVRLRSYALSAGPDGGNGYVLTWASLEQLDDSARVLGGRLKVVVTGGTTVAAARSYLGAGRARGPAAVLNHN